MSGSSGPSYLGAYFNDNPGRNDAGAMNAFKADYDAFTTLMGARPKFYNAYTDNGQGAAGLPASATWAAQSFAQTGDTYVGPNSGTTPVVGVPMSDSSGQWGSVNNYYQQIISGSLDADYKGIVDAWAQSGYKATEFRLGYEFTGGAMPWSPENSSDPNAKADFVKAFQHLADIMHSEAAADGTTAKIVWNPLPRQGTSYDIRTLYPGDQYVDVISTDVYSGGVPNGLTDWATGGTTQDPDFATWASKPANYAHYYQYQDSSQSDPTPGFGLAGWSTQNTIDFAQQHGKPVGFDEVGAGPGDDPNFPAWLGTAVAGAQAQGVTVDHVDVFQAGSWAFTGGAKPLEAAAWAQALGGAAASTGGNAGTAPATTSSSNSRHHRAQRREQHRQRPRPGAGDDRQRAGFARAAGFGGRLPGRRRFHRLGGWPADRGHADGACLARGRAGAGVHRARHLRPRLSYRQRRFPQRRLWRVIRSGQESLRRQRHDQWHRDRRGVARRVQQRPAELPVPGDRNQRLHGCLILT